MPSDRPPASNSPPSPDAPPPCLKSPCQTDQEDDSTAETAKLAKEIGREHRRFHSLFAVFATFAVKHETVPKPPDCVGGIPPNSPDTPPSPSPSTATPPDCVGGITSPTAPPLPRRLSLRRWFALFALWLIVGTGVLFVLIAADAPDWALWKSDPLTALRETAAVTKLLAFALYVSLACTFLPLPTGGLVAAVATQHAAVGPGFVSTTLLVASVGSVASTLANLNDYHLFALALRSRRIARIRQTRAYHRAEAWFARGPFALLLAFNVIPVPVDVVRMLAATYGYPRKPFALANLIGRFIRYAIIAAATYALGSAGWVAVVVLMGVGLAFALARLLPGVRRKAKEPANETGGRMS